METSRNIICFSMDTDWLCKICDVPSFATQNSKQMLQGRQLIISDNTEQPFNAQFSIIYYLLFQDRWWYSNAQPSDCAVSVLIIMLIQNNTRLLCLNLNYLSLQGTFNLTYLWFLNRQFFFIRFHFSTVRIPVPDISYFAFICRKIVLFV